MPQIFHWRAGHQVVAHPAVRDGEDKVLRLTKDSDRTQWVANKLSVGLVVPRLDECRRDAGQPRGYLLIEPILVFVVNLTEKLPLDARAMDDAIIGYRRVEGIAKADGKMRILVEKVTCTNIERNIEAAQFVAYG
jgi:hypothetical protein